MKVLQLCNKPPQPTIDGGCIAINNIAEGLLKKGIDLRILTIATEKHPFLPEAYSDEFKRKTAIDGVFVDTRINIIDAFSALITSDSYNVSRFFSPDFNKRLTEILEKEVFDIVHLESLFMTPYIATIRKFSQAKIVLRSHNLEHLIWERLAHSTGNTARRLYLRHLATRLKVYEKKTINEVEGIATISHEDTERFQELIKQVPILTIPFGIRLNEYPYRKNERPLKNRLFHIGAMNWEPNKEAFNWFLDAIWPLVASLNIEMHLAGRSIPGYMHEHADEKFIIHGEVDSALQFMEDHDVMIVPLLSGSGVRVKIIEAMAMGKAVITTTVGAEGIDCEDGKHILLADTAAEFAAKIQFLMGQPDQINRIGAAARKLVEALYDNDKVIDNLIGFYHDLKQEM
jgi:glycosyltransferase involved in cell wall biosynthesis